MTYSIKDAAAQVGLSVYTMRFYDKAGLLPFVARGASGYREFTDADINILKTIVCLKNTGMKIDDIRQYVDCIMRGTASIPERKALLRKHRAEVVAQQEKIAANLKEVDYKLGIYESADAAAIVTAELAEARREKVANELADPFEA
ncbi:MerR family transcriptional regulator [Lacticaseibacillus pabuli]|uniref:MerR family transcriptional regulator n=1 Tax=Lacticaseibacillus pabuli TaxID=3025672 RepID=A0ABY7WPJ7_9LACO|nr:MerR family transcriptional regulator [Lacticaseibacillus sp. KACC 23028]WDF82125.1 MerR family transcriptional regulator [Lacticaseibacillus sp. KACC 23028]